MARISNRKVFHRPAWVLIAALFLVLFKPAGVLAFEGADPIAIDLETTVAQALEANLAVQIASEQTQASDSVAKARRTELFPSLSTSYRYQRTDETRIGFTPEGGLVQPKEQYTWVTSLTQPVFTGFALTTQHQLAKMGFELARFNEALVKRDIVYEAKRVYFMLLKAQMLKMVAEEAVTMLEAQTEVAINFHEVGMTPLNDLLRTKVDLANARQDLVVAQNNLALARADFNLLLRRPIGAPAFPADNIDFVPFTAELESCLEIAQRQRVEMVMADLEIKISEKEVSRSRSDYYPTIQLQGNYYRQGTDWGLGGGAGFRDNDYWDIQAQARWDLWQWGRTGHGVAEKRSRLAEARLNRSQLLDMIQREVKQAWYLADESEKNIVTVESAVDQAKESFRISEALFKEQMATATDVLDARTQLSDTTVRYYRALYRHQIALAALDRAMGIPRFEGVATE